MPWESIALRGGGRDSPDRQGAIHSMSARVTASGRPMVEERQAERTRPQPWFPRRCAGPLTLSGRSAHEPRGAGRVAAGRGWLERH